jgi:hypothetical protein
VYGRRLRPCAAERPAAPRRRPRGVATISVRPTAGLRGPVPDPLARGRAVQVDPIKPTLTAPGLQRLKLKYYEVLSSFAFNFNLRRYTVVWKRGTLMQSDGGASIVECWRALEAGAYTRPLFS